MKVPDPRNVPVIDCSKVPESVWIDLCVMAIRGTVEAMKTPEGRATIEKNRQEYINHISAGKGTAREST